MHDAPLITTIAVALAAAWILGLLTQRLGLSPIVGYLVAGVLIGPHTPGFVGNVPIAQELAEVGVILLMFGVGLHFHWRDLLAVKSLAIPGAVGQSLAATLLGIVVFTAFGLPVAASAVMGMAMAVASTVVLMRVLMDAGVLSSPPGHVAVGWLLVEDVFTVVVLVLIPILGGNGSSSAGAPQPSLWPALGLALFKLGVLVVILMSVGARVIPWVLVHVARLRSRELFTLTVLVFSIAVAAGAYAFFGASMALGAFLAGMVVAQSPVSHQAAADAMPLRDAFAVLFFVSVGMLFDPAFVLREPWMILAALGIILLAKPLIALAIVALLGHSTLTALTVALGLAQIGEFSFILSELARKHHLMPDSGHNLLVAAAIISITVNPILFRGLQPIESWLRRRPRLWSLLNGRAQRRANSASLAAQTEVNQRLEAAERLAVVVGFGPVGRSVHRLLRDSGLTVVVVEMNLDAVLELHAQDLPAIFGDASHAAILEQAGMRRAAHLVLTLPDAATRLAVVTAAKDLNPAARILVRAHYLREREELERAGATAAVFEEAEAAVALARLVLAETGTRREVVERKVRDLRLQLIQENISVEDILEQVIDRIEDKHPHEPALSLHEALATGGVILDLAARTPAQAIAELAAAISAANLPPEAKIAEIAMAREAKASTDLGMGIAIPHARCPNLRAPLVVFGRSEEGIVFSPRSAELVRLIFLLVTPAERPDLQVSLLAKLARIAGDASTLNRLQRATSPADVIEIFSAK